MGKMSLIVVEDRYGDKYCFLDDGHEKVCVWTPYSGELPRYNRLKIEKEERYPILVTEQFQIDNKQYIAHFMSLGIVLNGTFYDFRDKDSCSDCVCMFGAMTFGKFYARWKEIVELYDRWKQLLGK